MLPSVPSPRPSDTRSADVAQPAVAACPVAVPCAPADDAAIAATLPAVASATVRPTPSGRTRDPNIEIAIERFPLPSCGAVLSTPEAGRSAPIRGRDRSGG